MRGQVTQMANFREKRDDHYGSYKLLESNWEYCQQLYENQQVLTPESLSQHSENSFWSRPEWAVMRDGQDCTRRVHRSSVQITSEGVRTMNGAAVTTEERSGFPEEESCPSLRAEGCRTGELVIMSCAAEREEPAHSEMLTVHKANAFP